MSKFFFRKGRLQSVCTRIMFTVICVCMMSFAVIAQLGSGWVEYSPTKKIHLDNEAGLQTFNWSASQSVCSPTCADYSYNSSTDVETFRILDNRSNRSEIRLQNEYSTGSRQFEGYVTFYAPLNDESLMQIFGSTSGATQMMIRGYAADGGSMRGAGQTLITGIYGQEVKVNVIHLQEDAGNKIIIYINGVKKAEIADNEAVTNYHKYGNYGTLTTDEAVVRWRRARFFRDGTAPSGTAPAAPSSLTATAVSTGQINLGWTDNSTNESDFSLERSTNGGSSWSVIATLAANTTTYQNTGLTPASTYHYRVRAVNTNGNSAYSNIDDATTQSPPVSPVYQAEDATINAGAVESNHTGYNGTGFVNYDNITGSYVEWMINVASAGTYNLSIRYANGSGANRPMSITVNGSVINSNMSFAATTAWTDWTTVNFTASLNAGINIIRATATTAGGGPNTDQLGVEGNAPQNVALNKPVTASGSDANIPANAVDGDIATRWSASPMPQWLEVDLGALYDISKTEVVCYQDRVYQFTIEAKTSSTGAYTPIVNRSANTVPGTIAAPVTDNFGPVAARFVRINITAASGYTGAWASILELRIFGVPAVLQRIIGTGSSITKNDVELGVFPNPVVNKQATIRYTLSKADKVRITVYSIDGREEIITNTYQQAGNYTIQWNALRKPAGIYIVKMMTGNETKSVKLTVK